MALPNQHCGINCLLDASGFSIPIHLSEFIDFIFKVVWNVNILMTKYESVTQNLIRKCPKWEGDVDATLLRGPNVQPHKVCEPL